MLVHNRVDLSYALVTVGVFEGFKSPDDALDVARDMSDVMDEGHGLLRRTIECSCRSGLWRSYHRCDEAKWQGHQYRMSTIEQGVR